MLFLYSSKRRHVESLLNCSANRWRFPRCLYEIKGNILLKKDISPCPFTFHCLAFSLSVPSLSFCLHLFLFSSAFFFSLSFGSLQAQAKSTLLLKVKWKVDRFVLPITASPGKKVNTKHLPEFKANQQTGRVGRHCRRRDWVHVSAGWTCLSLTQVDLCPPPPLCFLTWVW